MAESVLDQFKEVFKENKIDASKKVRIGIIGTGWIADAHMISYLKQPDVEIVAAADLVEGGSLYEEIQSGCKVLQKP